MSNLFCQRNAEKKLNILIEWQYHLHGVAGAPNGVAGACPNMSYF